MFISYLLTKIIINIFLIVVNNDYQRRDNKMKKNFKRINDNICKAECFQMKLADFVDDDRFALNSVERRYKYDENRKRTDVVDGIVYTVTDERLNRYKIKVPTTTPVIEQEEIDESDEIFFVTFPIRESVVKPYKMEYGRVFISITSPWCRLVSDDETGSSDEGGEIL